MIKINESIKHLETLLKIDGYKESDTVMEVLDDLKKQLKKCNLQNVSGSAVDIIKWMAECPYTIDQATVPKNGIEVAPSQVVGNMSLSYLKYNQLREIAKHYR